MMKNGGEITGGLVIHSTLETITGKQTWCAHTTRTVTITGDIDLFCFVHPILEIDIGKPVLYLSLIALSAKQIGSFVITNNAKDFLRIKEFVNFNLI